MISINVYNYAINVQKEIENIVHSDEIYESCEAKTNLIITLGKYLIIEINAMPAGKIS